MASVDENSSSSEASSTRDLKVKISLFEKHEERLKHFSKQINHALTYPNEYEKNIFDALLEHEELEVPPSPLSSTASSPSTTPCTASTAGPTTNWYSMEDADGRVRGVGEGAQGADRPAGPGGGLPGEDPGVEADQLRAALGVQGDAHRPVPAAGSDGAAGGVPGPPHHRRLRPVEHAQRLRHQLLQAPQRPRTHHQRGLLRLPPLPLLHGGGDEGGHPAGEGSGGAAHRRHRHGHCLPRHLPELLHA